MGVAAQYKQNQQNEQNRLDAQHLRCAFCGIDTQVRWYSWLAGNWVTSKPAYEGKKKKLLCRSCAGIQGVTVTPTWKSLSPVQRHAMQQRCFSSPGGISIVNPGANHNNFAFLAHFYPCYYLGEKKIEGTLKDVTQIRDCHILTFVPFPGQDSMMDDHVKEFGYIFTAMPSWYHIDRTHIPMRVQFYRWFDDRDISRTNFKRI